MKIIVTFDYPDIPEDRDAEFNALMDDVYDALEAIDGATNVYVDQTF